jgi:glycosyltransferase involved in cell wall biosynthesis
MRISIVTISYNQAPFLERCLRSVLDQGFAELEYIVVDPGSSDGSREIIERYRSQIDSIILEPDSGPAQGLNRGFDAATGEIFGYLNADDILLPGALNRVAAWFREEPRADVIYGNALLVDEEERVLRRMLSTRWSHLAYVYGSCNVAQQATFMRSSAFRAVHGFNEANRTCWDGELLVEMSLNRARFSRRQDTIGGFRLHRNSITGSGRLREAIGSDGRRIFRRVMGRPHVALDGAIASAMRIWKVMSHPIDTLIKVLELTGLLRRPTINERD